MKRAETPAAVQPLSLLVVDDEPDVLKMTQRVLERRGHSVVACRGGAEALEWISREVFDCLLTDLQMPGMDGLRLLRAARERDPDLPMILVTGNPDVGTAAAAAEQGAAHCLIKPVGNDRLEQHVVRAAHAGRAARAIRTR